MKLRSAALGLVAGAAVALPGVASASVDVPLSYNVNANVTLNATATQCDNRGASIDLGANVAFGGFKTDVTFENQDSNTTVPGHHSKTYQNALVQFLVDFGQSYSLPKQPAFGGVTGNPWIYARLENSAGDTSDWYLLGRCVTGNSFKANNSFGIPAAAGASLLALDCSSRGSNVSVASHRNHGSLTGEVKFTNNRKFDVHDKTLSGDASLDLVLPAEAYQNGNASAFGGNPLVSLQFKDDVGNAISENHHLGRCNQL